MLSPMRMPLMIVVAALCLGSVSCQHLAADKNNLSPIVGTWFVKIPEAPFKYHMLMFNSDGTMQQSNPDAGDANTSDSNGMGVWLKDGDKIKGKFVEITADRQTRQFVNRGEISFSIQVNGNALSGTASALFYDVNGVAVRGPISANMEGQRVMP
jgi:hypothetical protein